jgi:hypothetical protein
MFGVVWKDTSGDQPRKLMSSPESCVGVDSADQAKLVGRHVLADLAPGHKATLGVLAVVEVSQDMLYGLQGCERVHLPMVGDDGDELEFIDVSQAQYWQSQPWWVK